MLKKVICLWVIAVGVAQAEEGIPDALKVPEVNKAVLTAHAKGDQVYQCVANAEKYTWQLLKPDAELFDGQGQLLGHHSAGPAWQYKDGSRVIGKAVNKVDRAPLASIPWLLIEAVEHEGQGEFSKVKFIQRINTQGGLQPLSTCNANHLGSEKRIAYTADYVFYAGQ